MKSSEMNTSEVRSNPSASDEEPDEKEAEGPSESKWRSSIRKKMLRLGKKTRPMSWNLDARRGSRDETVRLSSQSLYVPSYSPPPPERTDVFHRSQKFGSFLSSKAFSQDEESSGKSFLKRMFPLKKSDSTSKVDARRNSCQIDSQPQSPRARTLENIPEKSRLKETKREGIQASQIKLRIRKFVTRGTFTSGIASFSTKFRDRLTPTQSSSVFYENDKELSLSSNEIGDTFECVRRMNLNHQTFRPKSNSVSQSCSRVSSSNPNRFSGRDDLCLPNNCKELPENGSPFSEDLESIRYIDSSSEEDIERCSRNPPSSRLTGGGLVRNEALSSSFQGDYRPRTNTDWATRRSLYLTGEINGDTKNADKVPPDKRKKLPNSVKEIERLSMTRSESCTLETSEASQFEASVSSSLIISEETPSNQVHLDIAIEASILPKGNYDTIDESNKSKSISIDKENNISEPLNDANLNEILKRNDIDVFESLKDTFSSNPILEKLIEGRNASKQNEIDTEVRKDSVKMTENENISPKVDELSTRSSNEDPVDATSKVNDSSSWLEPRISQNSATHQNSTESKKLIISASRNNSEFFDIAMENGGNKFSSYVLSNLTEIIKKGSFKCSFKLDVMKTPKNSIDDIPTLINNYNSIVTYYEPLLFKQFFDSATMNTTQFLPTVRLFDIKGVNILSNFTSMLTQSPHGVYTENYSLESPEIVRLNSLTQKPSQRIGSSLLYMNEMNQNVFPDKNSEVAHLNIETENGSKKMVVQDTNINKISSKEVRIEDDSKNWKTKRKRRKRARKNKTKKESTENVAENITTKAKAAFLTSDTDFPPSSEAQTSSTPQQTPSSLKDCVVYSADKETLSHLKVDHFSKNRGCSEQALGTSPTDLTSAKEDEESQIFETEHLRIKQKKEAVLDTTLSYAEEGFDYVELEGILEDIKPLEAIHFPQVDQGASAEEDAVTSDSYERCQDLVRSPPTRECDKQTRGLNSCHESPKMNVCEVCQNRGIHQRMHWQCNAVAFPTKGVSLFPDGSQHQNRLKRRNHVLCQTNLWGSPPVIGRRLENRSDPSGIGEENACEPNLKNRLCKTHVRRGERKRSLERYRSGNAGEKGNPSRPTPAITDDADGKERKSVWWILSEGEEILESHQVPPNTLVGISKEVDQFADFFSFAKFESEKSLSLLQEEEHFERCSETSEDTQDLAKDLRRHINSFADRLHLTKDRLEDTAKCYLLLDKAYEWALEAMKVVGRVKSSGTATTEQVVAAAEAIGELLQESPPVSEETFSAMLDLATRLDNQTLLQQCKMAHSRCKETIALLRSRQSALLKARHQMEFDCQTFVDLNEILSVSEDQFSLSSPVCFPGMPFNNSGRRRSGCSVGSRSRDPLSRCSSLETDDDSVFSETPFSSTPTKSPIEGKSSLRGIKELRESHEDLGGTVGFIRGNSNFFRSSVGSDFRLSNDPSPLGTSPSTMNTISGSTIRAFSSGSSSSCSSSDSSGPTTGNKKHARDIWRFTEAARRSIEENTDGLDDSILPLSAISNRVSLPSEANSHLLIRGSQINLSNSEDLTQEEVRKNKTLLLIMQELIQTERDYANSLEYIIENYVPELLREDIPQALRGQRNVIFGNIEKIYEFHSGYFLKALESCSSKPFAVGSVFLRYESQFYLYALYNKNKPKSDELMADFGSSFFKGKQSALGDKMDLSSYLLKPVQRMGKYALLLKQLLKECAKNEEGYDELSAAQEMVQFQLRHGNDLLAMDSLRDCDVNLKEQGRLLRQGEFLVMEGSRGKKSLRHVFIFEDLILFSKARKDPDKKNLDIFQYKQSLKTTDIGLTAQVGESPLRFEIWFRKRKPSDTFLFQAPSTEVKDAWTEEISKLLWRQALRNRKLRLHEMSSMGIGNKPCLDIRPSEDQINDRSVAITKAPTRLKLTASTSLSDTNTGVRRPHSVISVSSSASSAESSTHSSSAAPSFVGTLNLGFESGDSPKPLQRSVTRTSQCSAESGIITDIFPERDAEESHPRVERSNSTATNTSLDSALSPSSPQSQSSPLSPLEEPPPTTQLSLDISSSKEIKQLLTTEVSEPAPESSAEDWNSMACVE